MTKKAIITGITGQDGSYLSEFLIDKGYEVHGTVRRSSSINTKRIDDLISKHGSTNKLILHYSDLLDSSSLNTLVQTINPDEIYNLAAQSHVMVSFKNPMFTTQTGTIGSLSLLEAIRYSDKTIKFYQASSSEMYGGKAREPLNEDSRFDPRSPYAASKVFAHNMTKMYRDSYDLFCVNGILFNHESPKRGETFVTRKITKALGRIHLGIQEKLTLGNLDASRDWGYAGDYVEGMWKMMQHETPDDWVLATGTTHTVKEFLEIAFGILDLNWEKYVQTSERYFRPNEVEYLLGDASKAEKELNWKPKTSFKELVDMMVKNDIENAKQDQILLKENLIKPTWEYPIS
ncbi:MAG: GDP-mannose 4,6-dehydratase [Chloroflexota bacterium]|jgi:GDPmannose 4,6-dehydratase|nr:GDP-mannose 4,6-dehydratase [Chloroflexota bacterium]|tara:strand:- start:529 stop:1566 length:1038 start_codon:yes stop_codon:yes gene_type:complete